MVEFREYEPGDESGILDTFNLTFREVCGEDYVDRDLEHWRWEFEQNPAGRRILLAMADDGRVAAQYAGIPMRVHCNLDGGRELSFFHAVDSMVHPEFRKGLSKRPLFIEVAERFFERYGGSEDHLGFGYPVRPAWRIGERYLGYRLVRSIDFLRRPIAARSAADEGEAAGAGIVVERIERFGPEADYLFEDAKDSLACVTYKDARYLNWRYADCPSTDYTLLAASRAGTLCAWAVMRSEGALAPDSATIGDLLVPDGDDEALAALVAEAERIGREADCSHLMTVQNPELPTGRAFAALGFVSEPSSNWLERKLGSRDWTSGLTQEWLAQNWSYTLGDSDLF